MKIKGIEIYDNIKELEMQRMNLFKKFIQIDLGLNPEPGKPLGFVDEMVSKSIQFARAGKQTESEQELSNLRQSLWQKAIELNPAYLAFACIVKSIDGKKVDINSDVDVSEVNELILKKKLKDSEVLETNEYVKKNFLMI